MISLPTDVFFLNKHSKIYFRLLTREESDYSRELQEASNEKKRTINNLKVKGLVPLVCFISCFITFALMMFILTY